MALLAMGAVCGASVTGADGAPLGTITEIMIDADTGGIAYAVLTHGGVLGVGEKLFAVPWRRFTIDAADGTITLDVPADRLDALDGFDKDAWPVEGDPRI
jgi:sporulation protein YlmC with PRC-barrel domain